MSEAHTGANYAGGQGDAQSTGRQQATEAAKRAAGQVAQTTKEQAGEVTREVSAQARSVVADVRRTVTDQAHTQNDRLARGIRGMADELRQMAEARGESPASTVVSRVADSGRQFADYLADRGPEGVLVEVQEFARRRPGAFLAAALAAGFAVGRLRKSVMAGGGESPGASTDRQPPATPAYPPAPAGTTEPQLGEPLSPYPGTGRPLPPDPAVEGRLP